MLYTIDTITPICAQLLREGKRVILATGFFDLLHQEHINFLQKAKATGDVLIVAVESDERARQLKGEGRPIESQQVRCQHLLELTGTRENGNTGERKVVDYVIALGDDFDNPAAYESLMAVVRPTIYAVSSHTSHLELKQKLTEKYGGKLVVVHDFNPEVSTTKIVNTQKHV